MLEAVEIVKKYNNASHNENFKVENFKIKDKKTFMPAIEEILEKVQ